MTTWKERNLERDDEFSTYKNLFAKSPIEEAEEAIKNATEAACAHLVEPKWDPADGDEWDAMCADRKHRANDQQAAAVERYRERVRVHTAERRRLIQEFEKTSEYAALVSLLEQAKSARDRQARRATLARYGIPRKDLDTILDDKLDESQARSFLKEADEAGYWLVVLAGPTGPGKTTAAAEWLANKNTSGAFIDAAELSRMSRYDEKTMSAIEQVGALVIDDLGVEYNDSKGSFRSLFDGIINARYADCRPTVITTNCTVESFKEGYGERLVDRVREAGAFYIVNEPSRRKTGRKAAVPPPDREPGPPKSLSDQLEGLADEMEKKEQEAERQRLAAQYDEPELDDVPIWERQ